MHLGIDFGTCNTSAALFLDGTLKPVKEPLKQSYSFPSSVFVTKQGQLVVGQAAENQRKMNPSHYRREFKRELGASNPYNLGEQEMLPEALVSELLRSLKKEAELMVNQQLTSTVVTIPASYQSHKQTLMLQAVEAAGFTDIRLLVEPVAAAIYYTHLVDGSQALKEGEILLVYDLGGGTFDAALVQKQGRRYELLAQPIGDDQLGGVDFDRQIYQDLQANCGDTLQALLDPQRLDTEALRAKLIVGDWCREFKHQLSAVSDYEDLLPVGMSESYYLTQDSFATMIAPFFQKTCELCRQLVKNAGFDWDEVDRILMVGGSCRMPAVRSALEDTFERPVVNVDDPELAVALGAALFEESEHKAPKEEHLAFDIIEQPPDTGQVYFVPAVVPGGFEKEIESLNREGNTSKQDINLKQNNSSQFQFIKQSKQQIGLDFDQYISNTVQKLALARLQYQEELFLDENRCFNLVAYGNIPIQTANTNFVFFVSNISGNKEGQKFMHFYEDCIQYFEEEARKNLEHFLWKNPPLCCPIAVFTGVDSNLIKSFNQLKVEVRNKGRFSVYSVLPAIVDLRSMKLITLSGKLDFLNMFGPAKKQLQRIFAP
ncbi:DnaK family protein [Synechococcus sp. PCC 7335]|uniref:Hsp70 family protein n=1 Tax=Synechococcus sp. (strain ATCC 29403 / PCC 7335) TaxID=91464 RepID=UPI00017EDD74|nr:Hsp70 family protein [Synechococcus sp. PCC 7335]EDX82951.1 DnaK family protein [Synechococcus sp. PCC 7335]